MMQMQQQSKEADGHITKLALTFPTFGNPNIPGTSFPPIPSVTGPMGPVFRAPMSRIPAPTALIEAAIFAPRMCCFDQFDLWRNRLTSNDSCMLKLPSPQATSNPAADLIDSVYCNEAGVLCCTVCAPGFSCLVVWFSTEWARV